MPYVDIDLISHSLNFNLFLIGIWLIWLHNPMVRADWGGTSVVICWAVRNIPMPCNRREDIFNAHIFTLLDHSKLFDQ